MLTPFLKCAGLKLKRLSPLFTVSAMIRFVASCAMVSILTACETAPITPAPIREQSLSLPKETASIKPERVAITPPDQAAAKSTPSAPIESRESSPTAKNDPPASEPVKPKVEPQPVTNQSAGNQSQNEPPVAVATPLDGDGEPIRSVPQQQVAIMDENPKGSRDSTVVPSTQPPVVDPNADLKNSIPISTLSWVWPTDLPIAQPFSDVRKGVDFSGTAGQPVKAVASGVASYLGNSLRGYGQMVVIKHDQGFISVYANNSRILVKEGQKIEKGQKIAESGHADGSDLALHFELRQQGKPLDPSSIFPPRP